VQTRSADSIDLLNGDDGNDVIEGGLGADVMNGGAGSDLFLYHVDNPADVANLGGDTINGFQTGQDKISLIDLFSDLGIDGVDAFGGGYLKLEVVGDDTLLRFDADGGGDSFVTLATLNDVTNVALTDILVPPPGVA
jgi:Ca2+-binding RTX toxin-like protein